MAAPPPRKTRGGSARIVVRSATPTMLPHQSSSRPAAASRSRNASSQQRFVRPAGAMSRAASQHKRALHRPTGAPPTSTSASSIGHRRARERRKDRASSASLMRNDCASCSNHRPHIARGHRATIAPARAFMRLVERRRRARRRPGGRIKVSIFRF
ncbi:hypothetical protein F511_44129 [Dorcoceras hygrometricum]|uniref:Uncharacterized protein n=1 Tax=Dorcoceras hygrometricum TaxID=472368 RepID=A0A2Z7BSA2_9LAMI|nr:hypothetical protein F511_44129 [Dorcoceras hygrometricum]